YYGTFTRAAELLAGCLMALAVIKWGRRAPADRRAPWAVVLGPLALAAILVVAWRSTELDSWLYDGGLAAFSLLSVALIASARRQGLRGRGVGAAGRPACGGVRVSSHAAARGHDDGHGDGHDGARAGAGGRSGRHHDGHHRRTTGRAHRRLRRLDGQDQHHRP